jgi:hypothetical protein
MGSGGLKRAMKSRVKEGCWVLEWMNGYMDVMVMVLMAIRCHDSRHGHTKMLWFVTREWT